jgi:CelD/BcsL family acetyltransferase involved in cellulose biosynthesis
MLATGTGDCFHLKNGWFDAWNAAFGGAFQREGLTLVARRERLGPIGYRVLGSATNPHSVNYDAAPGAALGPDLPERLLEGAAMVRLEYLREDARLLEAARGWSGHRVLIAPHALTPVVDCRGRYADWLAARSKRIRHRLRRDSGKAMDAMGMRFEVTAHDPTQNGLIERMFELEQAGWKGRGGTAILDDPVTAKFYTELARNAAAAGALRTALLWHGEQLVAFEYGVIGGRRLFVLKVAYDEDFADLSLGYVAAALHIRHCFEDPVIDCYDKMGNGMTPAAYKLRFADYCKPLFRVSLFARGPLGAMLYLRELMKAQAKAWRDARRAGAEA